MCLLIINHQQRLLEPVETVAGWNYFVVIAPILIVVCGFPKLLQHLIQNLKMKVKHVQRVYIIEQSQNKRVS